MKKTGVILLFITMSAVLLAHPIKMSTGRIEIDSNTDSVAILINFFIDDFEPAIHAFYPQPPFNFVAPSQEMTFAINNYVQKNLVIMADNKGLKYQLVSVKPYKENVCQVRFTGTDQMLSTCKSFTIQNTILFDVYEKQSNIMHLKIDGKAVKILEFYPSSAVKIINK